MIDEIIEAIESGSILFPGELIRDVIGYEDLYQVTSFGRVWGIKRQKWLSLCVGSKGYLQVSLSKRNERTTKSVHILVLEAFRGLRPHYEDQTRHLDGNPLNNHLENIVWGNAVSNSQDRFKHGTDFSGEKSTNTKFTNEDVLNIRYLYDEYGLTHKEISIMYKVHESTIQHICRGRSWAHL